MVGVNKNTGRKIKPSIISADDRSSFISIKNIALDSAITSASMDQLISPEQNSQPSQDCILSMQRVGFIQTQGTSSGYEHSRHNLTTSVLEPPKLDQTLIDKPVKTSVEFFRSISRGHNADSANTVDDICENNVGGLTDTRIRDDILGKEEINCTHVHQCDRSEESNKRKQTCGLQGVPEKDIQKLNLKIEKNEDNQTESRQPHQQPTKQQPAKTILSLRPPSSKDNPRKKKTDKTKEKQTKNDTKNDTTKNKRITDTFKKKEKVDNQIETTVNDPDLLTLTTDLNLPERDTISTLPKLDLTMGLAIPENFTTNPDLEKTKNDEISLSNKLVSGSPDPTQNF